MEKYIVVYIVLVIISVLIFYVLAKRKSIILDNKKEELEIQKKTSERLVSIFYKILNNK